MTRSDNGDDPETELLIERRLTDALVDRSRLSEPPDKLREKIRADLERMEGRR